MIIQCDAKGLEIYCGAYLSQDKILMGELIAGLDIHGINQKVLGLPEGDFGRLIAKVFIFRLMYGGSAYSYSKDPDFMQVSTSEKFWQLKIDEFYHKYKEFAQWHVRIVREATKNGYLRMPTGRQYDYELVRNFRGELEAPQTTIKNYPVQGLGADVMAVARVSCSRRWKRGNINGVLVNTVHDSIVGDIAESEVGVVSALFHGVFADLPTNFRRVFGVEFNLPLRCEVKYGPNSLDMEEWKEAA